MGLRMLGATGGALVLLAFASPAIAAPGQPDLTFGFDGVRTVDFGGDDVANAVAVAPNGKVVLAGYSVIGGDQDVAIARLTANGAPDPSFSGDGRFTYEPAAGLNGDYAKAVAVQPDGKIVFAGHTPAGTDLADVGRLADDGSFDGTFDGDGHRGYEWGGTDVATSVAVRPNGKLVIGGYTSFGEDIVVQQADADGSPDPSFGAGGGARRIPRAGLQQSGAVALQPDGKVLVVGTTYGATSDIIVSRLTANGALDPSFGGSGTVVVGLPGNQFGPSVMVAPDGKIILGGTSQDDFMLVRLNPNGSFDGSFGTGGRAVLNPVGAFDLLYSAAVQPDGKVVLVGTVSATAGAPGFAEVERVTAAGAWDPTFHTDGHVGFYFGSGESLGLALTLQPDGKIVVAGRSMGNQDFGVARLEGGPFPPPPPPPPPRDSDGDGVVDPNDRCVSVHGGRFDADRDGCPGPYARIDFGLRGGWNVLKQGIRIVSETVTRVPAGATVRVRCKSCRIRQTLRPRSSRVKLKKLRGKLLRRGQSFSVRVTAPGHIGQVKTLTVKRYGKSRRARRRIAADPFKTRQRCIPVGATKPARRCSATPPVGP